MSEPHLGNAVQGLKQKALSTAWAQWSALGAAVSNAQAAHSIIDPEALLLLSLLLAEEECRLWDLLGWWARVGSHLLSVQRVKNLTRAYPNPMSSTLGQFAHLARSQGGDSRWKSLARPQAATKIRFKKGFGERLTLVEPATLFLRLRAGFGVGIKADVLGYLLGLRGTWVIARDITEATSYTAQAIRRALEDMAAARLVETIRQTPTKYRVDPQGWVDLLGLREAPPVWRDWQSLFAFIGHLSEWSRGDANLKTSPYVLSSRARELFGRHQSAFIRNQITVPDPRDYPRERYLEAFEDTLCSLGEWMQKKA
jgi:hypothetical protein